MSHAPSALLALGFGLGLRHALDADHVAAVAALTTRERHLGRSSAIGALWGLGHGAALLAVSLAVIGLRAEIPPALGAAFELVVATVLVVMGGRLLWSLAGPSRDRSHPALDHHHPRKGPLLVGMLHGLAGSAGLMLTILATIPDRALAFLYVATFAAGAVLGMAALATAIAIPTRWTAQRFGDGSRWTRLLQGAAATGSIAAGLVLAAGA